MAAFHEILFPLDIALKSAGGPERKTEIVALGSGREERNARWAHSRRRYDAGYGVKTLDALSQVVAFFEERRGRLHGFRWRDRLDHSSAAPGASVSPLDQAIGTGDGATRRFRSSSSMAPRMRPIQRPIAKPVAGSVRVAVGGVEQTEGVGVHLRCHDRHRDISARPRAGRGRGRARPDFCSTCRCASTPTISRSISPPSRPAACRAFRWWRSSREKHPSRPAGQAGLRRHHARALLDRHAARRRHHGLHRSRLRSHRRGHAVPRRHRAHSIGGDRAARPAGRRLGDRGRARRQLACRNRSRGRSLRCGEHRGASRRLERAVAESCCSRKGCSAKCGARARPSRRNSVRSRIGSTRRAGGSTPRPARPISAMRAARSISPIRRFAAAAPSRHSPARRPFTPRAWVHLPMGGSPAGKLAFTGGANAGFAVEVKTHRVALDGVLIELWQRAGRAARAGRRLHGHRRLRQALCNLPRPLRQRGQLPRLPAHPGERFRHFVSGAGEELEQERVLHANRG